MTDITTKETRRRALAAGMHDGIPIGLGYFAVAFALGIAARNAGLNAVQSFIVSLFCNASAGEYAGFTLIASGAAYTELALMTLVANARYLLMSCALTVAMAAPATPQRNTMINSRSSPTFSTVENSRNASGVTLSPMLRRNEQMKL